MQGWKWTWKISKIKYHLQSLKLSKRCDNIWCYSVVKCSFCVVQLKVKNLNRWTLSNSENTRSGKNGSCVQGVRLHFWCLTRLMTLKKKMCLRCRRLYSIFICGGKFSRSLLWLQYWNFCWEWENIIFEKTITMREFSLLGFKYLE